MAENGAYKISSTQDVVIAFYKTSGEMPAFKRWIRSDPEYKYTPIARQKDYRLRARQRLLTQYNAFNPQRDLLTVKGDMLAHVVKRLDPDNPDNMTYHLDLKFHAGQGVSYFPYTFLGEHFALIPQDMDTRLHQRISKDEYDYLFNVFKKKGKRVIMIMQLRPLKADTAAPYHVDGRDQWAFLTDVATFSLWRINGGQLYAYAAPWHQTDLQRDLLGLHKGGQYNDSDEE